MASLFLVATAWRNNYKQLDLCQDVNERANGCGSVNFTFEIRGPGCSLQVQMSELMVADATWHEPFWEMNIWI